MFRFSVARYQGHCKDGERIRATAYATATTYSVSSKCKDYDVLMYLSNTLFKHPTTSLRGRKKKQSPPQLLHLAADSNRRRRLGIHARGSPASL